MNRPVDLDLRALGPAWRALRKASGNRIGPIRTRAQYERMLRLLRTLVDEVGDDERHPLADLLHLVGDLVEAWESSRVDIPEAEPRAVLQLLMEQQGLKQGDLGEIATQSVISEILAGKRRINARQAKALAGRFGVSAAVFL
jgi:HTH-type transcriptional regulator/antitoxin HigA